MNPVDRELISLYDINMGDLLIRNVPPVTLDALKRRAKNNGRSVQAEVLEVLQEATKPAGSALAAWLREHRDPKIDLEAALRAIRETRDER